MAGKKKSERIVKEKKAVRAENFTDSAEFAMHLAANTKTENNNPAFKYLTRDNVSQDEDDSSVPLGDFVEETAGLAPRSRHATMRDAQTRDQEEFIRRCRQNIGSRSKGLLDVEEDMIPAGYTFLWARASVRDHPDAANLRQLEKNGWIYVTAEMMPGLAFYDPLHGIRDDAAHIYNDGLVAMIRLKELTDYENKFYLRESQSQTNSYAKDMKRKDDSEMNPFLHSGRTNGLNNMSLDLPYGTDAPTGQDFRSHFGGY